MKIEKNKSLKEFTTWRVGGPADYFVNAETNNDVKEAIIFANTNKIPFVIIGNGSNILVNDKGFRGIVIKLSNKEIKLASKNKITCSAGLQLSQLLKFINEKNLYGAEFLWGIPGTIGGAIVGNAGMNNQEIKDILINITTVDKDGKIKKIRKSDIKFSYRNSELKKKNMIILSAELKLSNKNIAELKNLHKKRSNQPKGFSAGSVFKNPSKKIAAGKLIDEASLKGKKIGGAEVSKTHGNFILNKKNAKASDILKLIEEIQKRIKNKFGVQLKREIRILGERGWQ
jgi:UDP-N-acetylmuramate dehydrogenase